MSAVLKPRVTEAEYLAFERASETRHEFLNADIIAMAGASEPHNLISGNLFTELNVMLKGAKCRAYTHDMRVKPSSSKSYVYPDIVVACPPIEFLDEKRDTLLNPQVVVEVLSPTTEGYDRGDKFDLYRESPSLQQYVLFSQDAIRAVSYIRQSDGVAWLMRPLDNGSDTIDFPSLGISVSLADIYRNVERSAPQPPQSDTVPNATPATVNP